MNKKAQALVISIWVISSLSVLAVAVGYRVSLGLRLTSYQRDRLKAIYLAKAGINRAINVIINDTAISYDSLTEDWAADEKAFKKISFNENSGEFASVRYNIINENNEKKTVYGLIDEERKININFASQELLAALLEKAGIEWEQQDIINNILIWRGDIPDTYKIYDNVGYPCKAGKMQNVEELILVKGITSEDVEKLRKNVTVYTDGLININTVSLETLEIVLRGIAKRLILESVFADSVAKKIIALRNEVGYFSGSNDIKIATTGSEEVNILNDLLGNIVFKSDNFLITANGSVNKINREVEAVYNRKQKLIKYWHET